MRFMARSMEEFSNPETSFISSRRARAINLAVGMAVEARGKTRPMPGGRFVIDADEVNGTVIGHHQTKKKHAK
jgi:hypothetical protein